MIAAVSAWPALPFASAAGNTATMSDAPPADEALVRATLAGDEEAFAEIVRRHKGRVFGACSRFARDAHQLDDLCQEVFLRLYVKGPRYREIGGASQSQLRAVRRNSSGTFPRKRRK